MPDDAPGLAVRRVAAVVVEGVLNRHRALDEMLEGSDARAATAALAALSDRDRALTRAIVAVVLRRLGTLRHLLAGNGGFSCKTRQRAPRIFSPFGAIPSVEVEDWLRRTGLILPSDLIELWQQSGGGDVFESETILRPTVSSSPNSCFLEDDIEGINAAYADEGKSGDLYVFHRGLFSLSRSAFRSAFRHPKSG